MLLRPTRRKLITGAAALGAASMLGIGPSLAAITQTPVASVTGQGLNTSGANVVLGSIDTTGSSYIRVALSWYSQVSGSNLSITDNKGNTYTLLLEDSSNADNCNIAYYACFNPVVGTAHIITVNNSGGALYASIEAVAYAGVKTTSPIEATPFHHSSSSPNQLASPFTPSSSGALLDLVASVTNDASGNTMACDSGFTTINTVHGTSGIAIGLASFNFLQTTPAAVQPTFSWNSGGPGSFIMAVIDPTGGAPPAVTNHSLSLLGIGR